MFRIRACAKLWMASGEFRQIQRFDSSATLVATRKVGLLCNLHMTYGSQRNKTQKLSLDKFLPGSQRQLKLPGANITRPKTAFSAGYVMFS
jgi:ribosomal protein L33